MLNKVIIGLAVIYIVIIVSKYGITPETLISLIKVCIFVGVGLWFWRWLHTN